MPREVPIRVYRRANDPAVIWRFRDKAGAPVSLPDRLDLTIDLPDQPAVIVAGSADGGLVLDRDAGTVTWRPAIADTVRLPPGEGAIYELMGTAGPLTRLWAGGRVIVEGFRA